MAVKLDASVFRQRMYRIQGELLSAPGGSQSIADASAYEISKQIRDKYRITAKSNYQWHTQVGITQNDFITATAEIGKLGTNHYGILNKRAMGDERDIKKIANIKGLWHQGTRAFNAFDQNVLNDPKRSKVLEGLRLPYWTSLNGGRKVPQWIYLEYGDDNGGLTAPGFALMYARDPKYIYRRWHTFIKNRIKRARI